MGKEWNLRKAFHYVFRQFSGEGYYLLNCNVVRLQCGWVQCCENLTFVHLTSVTRHCLFFLPLCIWFPSSASHRKKKKEKKKGKKKLPAVKVCPTGMPEQWTFTPVGRTQHLVRAFFQPLFSAQHQARLVISQSQNRKGDLRWAALKIQFSFWFYRICSKHATGK